MVAVYVINTVNVTFGSIVSNVTFLVFIFGYIQMGYSVNAELIFYLLNLFNTLYIQFGYILPRNFSRIAQLYASLLRLNKILQAEELQQSDEGEVEKPLVLIKDVTFNLADKEILKNISMSVKKPGLTVVTGTVGSGKSSLLKIMLRDYQPITEGLLEIHGNISYASQDPWLFPASIRQNILFGEEYDKARYDEVVRVCALEYDFSLLDDGDLTILADKGMNLSKGQQARVNLARAVYRQANIYLFDDSLTALDNHVQDFIFSECLMKFLSDKICILVSQNSVHMRKADNVVILNEGKLIFSGDSKIIADVILDDVTKRLNEENAKKDEEVADSGGKKSTLVPTEQQQSHKNVYKEVKKVGNVELNVYQKYFQYGGGLILFSFIILLYIVAQFCESYSDKLQSKWADLQQKVIDLENNSTTNGTEYENALSDKDHEFLMYSTFCILKCVMGLVDFYALMRFCQQASVNLHKSMVKGLMGATMAFYDNHFIGNILNRFSYDLNNIDEFIPLIFPAFGDILFSVFGSIILITTLNYYFLIPVAVFLIILLILRMFFMPTARCLKRLEASTRSPLVGHLNSSLEGVTTIRAFGAQQILKNEFDKHQDLYTSAFMTLRVSMLSFGFFIDVLSSLFTITIIARFLFFEKNTSAGNVGLALTQVFQLTDYVEMVVRMWADFENAMTSVERAVEYTSLDQETREGHEDENWPTKGSIKFEKVKLCYDGCKNAVLKGITFDVKSREKIGVVGRTGAGKSSIITVLYRLYEFDGKIEIDGIDTKTLSLEYLRRNISIIPQDPILFTATIRENIDPSNKYSDDQIWEIIDKVGIKELVPTLDTMVGENGSKYSSGEKQLFCLARAAIGKCKILILDEATANMDAETEKMLHTLIDEIFTDCTTLTIAHRLHSILDCDKVLVLDNGEIIEYDDPKVLRKNSTSMFNRMYQESIS